MMITKSIESYLTSQNKDTADQCKLAMDTMLFIDKALKYSYIMSKSSDDPAYINYAKASIYDQIEANLDSGDIRKGISLILNNSLGEIDLRLVSFQLLFYVCLKTDAGSDIKVLEDIEFQNFSKTIKRSTNDLNRILGE